MLLDSITKTIFIPVWGHIQQKFNWNENRKNNLWHLCLIASFAYEEPTSINLDVELLFDSIKRQFYQPDIGYCEIEQPKVQLLFQAWQSAFLSHLNNHQFDEINLTIMKYHIDTTDHALCIKP
ncbi:DUF2787 family protein [Vibrio sp. Vb2704]|uniref:DUF2787 family protein n=1 Tax=Vibrio sp. Vb2704 TaxID=3074673 RepID=UPI00398D0AF1